MVAFEVIHHMKRKTRGKKEEIALKVDISKVHDRVDWEYLRLSLLQLGFDSRWVRMIMLCVSSVKNFLALNGAEFGPIFPNRGL